MDIGNKIKKARKEKGMSQTELAKMLNVDLEIIQSWEEESLNPRDEELIQVCNILNIPFNISFLESEKENDETTIKYKRLCHSRYILIKVFTIIGCVLLPLSIVAALIPILSYYSLLFLGLYFITVPFCQYILVCLKGARCKKDLVRIGISTLIFVSFIGGIIILCTTDKSFEEKVIKKHSRLNLENDNNSEQKESLNPYINQCLEVIDINREYVIKTKIDNKIKEEVLAELTKIEEEAYSIDSYEKINNFYKKVDKTVGRIKLLRYGYIRVYFIIGVAIIAFVLLMIIIGNII